MAERGEAAAGGPATELGVRLGEENRRESEDLKLASCFPEVTQGFPDSASWSLGAKIMGLEERRLGGERSV